MARREEPTEQSGAETIPNGGNSSSRTARRTSKEVTEKGQASAPRAPQADERRDGDEERRARGDEDADEGNDVRDAEEELAHHARDGRHYQRAADQAA